MMSFPAYPENVAMMDISGQNGLQNSMSSDDMMDTDTPALQNGSHDDVPAEHKSEEPKVVDHQSSEEGEMRSESLNGNTVTEAPGVDCNSSIAPGSSLDEERGE